MLTDQEKQFLSLACQGLTNAKIATEMFRSPRTIDNYREAIKKKTGSRNMAQTIATLYREGILPLADQQDVKTHIDRMHKIIDYCLSNKLPKEHHFFGTTEQIRHLTDWLNMLGSSGIQTDNGSGNAHITFFMYGGFTFYYHDMDKLPTKEPT